MGGEFRGMRFGRKSEEAFLFQKGKKEKQGNPEAVYQKVFQAYVDLVLNEGTKEYNLKERNQLLAYAERLFQACMERTRPTVLHGRVDQVDALQAMLRNRVDDYVTTLNRESTEREVYYFVKVLQHVLHTRVASYLVN